ncbi:hypothetical protein HWV62_6585 [Athelia sp. TMB]|nr:hypothetical protein HWV62_6585 [Athelia sp. TMB]
MFKYRARIPPLHIYPGSDDNSRTRDGTQPLPLRPDQIRLRHFRGPLRTLNAQVPAHKILHPALLTRQHSNTPRAGAPGPPVVAAAHRGPVRRGRDARLGRAAVVVLESDAEDAVLDTVRDLDFGEAGADGRRRITTTIIAPTPLVAANFIILGEIIRRLGPRYSRMSPMCFDVVSLVVQAVGGAIASSGESKDDRASANKGGHIMLGGIVFQMFSITAYVFCASEFLWRYISDKPLRTDETYHKAQGPRVAMDKRLKIMLSALAFDTLCIYIRYAVACLRRREF